MQRWWDALTIGERIAVQLVSRFIRLDLTRQENVVLFVCIETTESKPVKQESSSTYSDTTTYGECSLIYLNLNPLINTFDVTSSVIF